MRSNDQSEDPEDFFRKSITVPFLDYTLNEMKTRFLALHARTDLGLQLVPYIIENIAPKLSSRPPPPPPPPPPSPVKRVSGSAPGCDGNTSNVR